MLILGKAEMFYLIKFKGELLMVSRVGYIGTVDNKFKVWFDGDQFITKHNGMNICIDYESIPENRKQRLA